MKKIFSITLLIAGFWLTPAQADERSFTYVYEANVLPQGEAEFEQWITNQNGKEDGDYSQWNFRTELEYGVTERYMTALYLNLNSTRSDGVTGIDEEGGSLKFKGFSWENIYQILNPNLDPVGLAAYIEYTSDGLDQELESKILLSKPLGNWILALNGVYEAEWEREDGKTEREGTLEFVGGASYKVTPNWSIGVEARNKSAYPDGLNLSGQEYNCTSVGPNVHYDSSKWWATLTILPQVWGNGDGAQGSRQLVHEESMEVRLLVGTEL